MKYTTERPYADPEKATRRLMEHARAFEAMLSGRDLLLDQRRDHQRGDDKRRAAANQSG